MTGMSSSAVLLDEELDMQPIEALPARETLWSINVTNVIGVNIALAVNAASIKASASAVAGQHLAAAQSAAQY
jgi:hypothetical protein